MVSGAAGIPFSQIGVTKAFLPDHLLIIDQRDAEAGDLVFCHLAVDQPGQVFFGVLVTAARIAFGNRCRGGAAAEQHNGAGNKEKKAAGHGEKSFWRGRQQGARL